MVHLLIKTRVQYKFMLHSQKVPTSFAQSFLETFRCNHDFQYHHDHQNHSELKKPPGIFMACMWIMISDVFTQWIIIIIAIVDWVVVFLCIHLRWFERHRNKIWFSCIYDPHELYHGFIQNWFLYHLSLKLHIGWTTQCKLNLEEHEAESVLIRCQPENGWQHFNHQSINYTQWYIASIDAINHARIPKNFYKGPKRSQSSGPWVTFAWTKTYPERFLVRAGLPSAWISLNFNVNIGNKSWVG